MTLIANTIDHSKLLKKDHNKNEPFYYAYLSEPTYCGKPIEYVLRHLIGKFRTSDTNELYVVSYPFLEAIVKNVCTNYGQCVDFYNECIEDLSLTPVIPDDIWKATPAPLADGTQTRMMNGSEVQVL
ncbi:hypothetical protein ON010_g11166 [Phytophthora cinnamomi]|nr:hypothetical protein ON010_g11166 [Phytophthora cinnamomi]